jgi:hypothetical protein
MNSATDRQVTGLSVAAFRSTALGLLVLAGIGLAATAFAGPGQQGQAERDLFPGFVRGSLSLEPAPVSEPDQTAVVGCSAPVLVTDNGTSGNERAPTIRNRAGRSVYLIKQTELAAAGWTNGMVPAKIGWSYQVAPGLAGSGPLIVYMQNTADTTNTKSTTWRPRSRGCRSSTTRRRRSRTWSVRGTSR